ncbi:RxLR effector protein [Phytophthora megakarya]|uniref:RxLR effector protein n=1 Tax=Phytophthora megakarya TaxID=4795 RepID=A0A225X0D5_9STRA|nr:RxLR effector protein [Phytophthora megakarya]
MRFICFLVFFVISCHSVADVHAAVITPYVEPVASLLKKGSEKAKNAADDVATANKKLKTGQVPGTPKLERADTLGKKSAEAAAIDKKVEAAMGNIKAGGEVKPLNDANPKWTIVVSNLKGSDKLKNVDEKELAKITERVAKEAAEDPARWITMKKFLMVTYGVTITALIAAALIAMGN